LNANDRSAIVAQKNIGQSFSGTVKAVGGKLESNDIKKGDKVYGFYTAGGAISDFIIVPAANVRKITGSIDLKTAAALPHIAQVATQLNSTVANGKKVFFSGPKGGLYESIFNGVAKKNTATVQPNADSLVDFLFHSEGNVAVSNQKTTPKPGVSTQSPTVPGQKARNSLATHTAFRTSPSPQNSLKMLETAIS